MELTKRIEKMNRHGSSSSLGSIESIAIDGEPMGDSRQFRIKLDSWLGDKEAQR